jgi:glucose/arabinose dehydrogenase
MKRLLATLLASLAATAAYGAFPELNTADGSIESADGLFVGRDFSIINGFKLELLHVAPTAQGQWVAVGWDNKGRLIVPSYNSDRMARLTIPKVGTNDPVKVEMIESTKVAAAEGVLYAFNSLYFNANRSNTARSGLYRMRDTNNDDKYDETRVIRNRQGSGDHGTHTLQLTPDGRMITMISGNATHPTEYNRSRVPAVWGEDNLNMRMDLTPPGFHRAPEATLHNLNADGTDVELWSIGMRNPVSMAYNKDGELFVYDADEEPNMGFTVGYRPTDILHAISGADAGWRSGSKVHATWQFDFYGPIGNVGSGSPVGSSFGIGTKFPAKYQDAFYAGDWSFGNLWAVDLKPDGSSYIAEAKPFISGKPFPVSGIIPNPADGSLLVATTGTQLYRVTYVGNESTEPSKPDARYAAFRDQRHKLEAFHGKKDPAAINAVWPFLSDGDRATRYAARVAVEWQDVGLWREKALNETDPRRAIAAIAALARVSGNDEYHTPPGTAPNRDKALQNRMFATLDRIDWNQITYQDKLDLLRAYQLVMIRLGAPDAATTARLIAKFDPKLPTPQQELNRELAEVLVGLQAPSAPAKLLALIKNAPGTPYFGIQEWINPQQRVRQDRGDVTGPNLGLTQASLARQDDQIFYAQLLRTQLAGWTQETRKEYMTYFVTEPANYRGNLPGLVNIRADAVAQIPVNERAALQSLINTPMPMGNPFNRQGGVAPVLAPETAAAQLAGRGTPGLALPAINLYVQPGGAARAFTDPELTAMTRYDETMEKEIKAQYDAMNALTEATFATPANPALIRTRTEALAQTELALATVRSNGYARLRDQLKITADKVPALAAAINNRSGGRGRAGAAAPVAAPAPGRGN